MNKPLIALYTSPGFCITIEQYEEIKHRLEANFICSDSYIGDSLLAELLLSGESKYRELKNHG